MVDMTHERARELVEFWLASKQRSILTMNQVTYKPEFIKKHKLEKRFQGHSYDIWTNDEIIEIDDLKRHSKKSQKINDGIATEYAKEYLCPLGFNFYRLLKEEIVDSKGYLQPTAAEYLRKNLF